MENVMKKAWEIAKKGFNNQVAMLEFDNEDNCLTDLNFGGMDLMGFSQNGIREEMEIISEVVA